MTRWLRKLLIDCPPQRADFGRQRVRAIPRANAPFSVEQCQLWVELGRQVWVESCHCQRPFRAALFALLGGGRMSLEQIAYMAQIIASVGVVLSLIFVGLQVRQSTAALQRNEHNSTTEQWTVIRMAIAKDRDIAELMTAGFGGTRPLDEADQLRLEQLLQENAWASFHIWDRTRRGVFPKGTFEQTGGALLRIILKTPRGDAWWQEAKTVGFVPDYVADVDAVLADD